MRLNSQKGSSKVWVVVVLAVFVLASAGYFIFQSDSDDDAPVNNQEAVVEQESVNQNNNDTNDTQEQEQAVGTVITTGDSAFGTMLFDDQGQAIYIWEVEETNVAECYDDCAVAWPPVLTDGMPSATGDVNSDLLGTTERTDGTTQVTYNDHPLYYYAHEGPGEVKCHNISTHGGLWWVIQPNGDRAP